jgi:hypothetical protein
VLPVTLRYSVPSGFNLCWAAPLGTGAHFWKTMCAWGKHVDVEILPIRFLVGLGVEATNDEGNGERLHHAKFGH